MFLRAPLNKIFKYFIPHESIITEYGLFLKTLMVWSLYNRQGFFGQEEYMYENLICTIDQINNETSAPISEFLYGCLYEYLQTKFETLYVRLIK